MVMLLWAVVFVALAIAGAAARRFMGGWGGKNPRGVHLLAVSALTGLVTAFGIDRLGLHLYVGLAYIFFAMLFAGIAASMGDGDGTDMGEWDKPEPDASSWSFFAGKPDNTEPYETRKARDLKVLMWSGFFQTVFAGLAITVAGRPFLGLFVGASGVLKAPAYALAYKVPSRVKNFVQGRELGEAFWGATLGLTAAATAFVVYA